MGSPVDLMAFLRHVQLRKHDYISFCVGGMLWRLTKNLPEMSSSSFLKLLFKFLNLLAILRNCYHWCAPTCKRFVKRVKLLNRKLSKQIGKKLIGINKIGKAHSIDGSDSTLKGAKHFTCIVVSTFSERAYNEVDNMQKNF